MPYCLYVRKSRADAEAEARGEGETLTRHIHTLLELAKRRKLDVTQIHREIVSGETIAARPVMQQLLGEVENGMWDGVLVMEVERLARGDTIDQGIVSQTFKFSNTKIITPIKEYNPNDEYDEEYFEFGLFMSRREYKTINRRLQRGRIASVNEGKYVGNKPPYGYQRERLEKDKGFTLAPHPEEAEIVRLIFELYTKGEKQADNSFCRIGVSLIARRLNEMHIAPRNGIHWSPATIRGILTNPVYIGKIRWNHRQTSKRMVNGNVTKSRPRNNNCIISNGLHPPIIDRKIFDMAQDFMAKNPPRPVGKYSTVTNPLAGLIVCSECGRKMVRRPYTTKQMPSLLCTDTACPTVSSAFYLVEERVLNSLRDWLPKYRLEWEAQNHEEDETLSITLKEKVLEKLITDRSTLCKQLDSVHDLLEQGIYTTDQFLDRSRALSERIRQNQDDQAKLKEEISIEKRRRENRGQIIPKVEHLLEIYDSLPSAEAKNNMLKEVLEKVVYSRESGGRWNGSQDNFELILFPKISLS